MEGHSKFAEWIVIIQMWFLRLNMLFVDTQYFMSGFSNIDDFREDISSQYDDIALVFEA